MLNVHCIEGRLAESPILKKTESGTCYTRVLLISKETSRTKDLGQKSKVNPKTGVEILIFAPVFILSFETKEPLLIQHKRQSDT